LPAQQDRRAHAADAAADDQDLVDQCHSVSLCLL
jgi:hypothetical protein